MKPIIGVPLRYDKDENGVSHSYMYETLRMCIQKIGGEVMPIAPIVITDSYKTSLEDFPKLSDDNISSLNRFLDMCDGIILPGGTKYLESDKYILDYAIKKDIPVLGICLSMQMMSCYKEDHYLEKIDDNHLNHSQSYDEKYKHKVIINKNSLLYKIIGREEINVNSFHKYAATPNNYYSISATSEDGIIEAIELNDKRFNIGVQWHPERMIDYDDASIKLMNYFMDEVVKYHNNKSLNNMEKLTK